MSKERFQHSPEDRALLDRLKNAKFNRQLGIFELDSPLLVMKAMTEHGRFYLLTAFDLEKLSSPPVPFRLPLVVKFLTVKDESKPGEDCFSSS